MSRPIYEIAKDIRADWKIVSPYAKPYLTAMGSLSDIRSNYFHDSAESVVLYFLSNASTWRGENARRLKGELKSLLKGV